MSLKVVSILSPDWPYTQNEIRIKVAIYRLSQKMWLFANDSKYRHIIYRWKLVFITRIDLRSFSQNKALVGSDQLLKFCHFAWKSVPTMQTLSWQMKGTIRTKGQEDWLAPTLAAKTGLRTTGSHNLPTSDPPLPTAVIGWLRSRALAVHFALLCSC